MADNEAAFAQFHEAAEKLDFPQAEEETLRFWKEIDAFHESLRRTEGKPAYSFYDGPPFATGLPHYGHLLAGTIKDTVTRYASQTGHHVVRRFGWDCHGLPVEYEIDKTLGIKSRDDVLSMGIDVYNAECENIVMRYAGEWENIVERMGRWIDFKNDYKTMDLPFMESVWWVFKTMYDKGLVYRGFKVMPYSTACATPLSNFEAGQAYEEVNDPAVIVSFPLEEDPDVAFIAWTTTPWTLPSNLALCVHPELTYVKVRDLATDAVYIMMEARLTQLFPEPKKKKKNAEAQYEVLETYVGADLAGKRYIPLFDYFADRADRSFVVLSDTYVTADSGTGIVHQAPAFGEDDYRVCLAAGVVSKGIDLPCPVDDDGCFSEEVYDFVGQHVKAADPAICAMLKERGRLVNKGTIKHSYPFCWRSDTPLIYKAVSSWFVDVPSIKERLLANNEDTYWVPNPVKEGRFANWLADARDWAISRNRFWGTPLPIWANEDFSEVVVIGSVAELEERTGTTVTNLHRQYIDDLTIPSADGTGVLRRVDEVFDCWFESGSMPYAQQHYPFENAEEFEKDYFPANFIAEGLDQTRGWFYTLLVISTALFDKPPFQNLIVNGMVLAADGKKMSKRKKNYPDPMKEIVDVYGADALRLYLINSPVVRAEPLRFLTSGVHDIIKDVFNPLYNAYRFFLTYVARLQNEVGVAFDANPGAADNTLDKWVLSAVQSLVGFVHQEMAAYRLYTVVPKLLSFVKQLTNWYVRLNRGRIKGQAGVDESRMALSVLFRVLVTLTRTLSPFAPFLAELLYQNLRMGLPEGEREDSVHYTDIPVVDESLVDPPVEAAVGGMQAVIELARTIRDRTNKPAKYPLRKLVVIHQEQAYLDNLAGVLDYVKDEVNVVEVELTTETATFVTFRAEPLGQVLGPRLGAGFKAVGNAIRAMTHDEIAAFRNAGTVTLEGVEVSLNEVSVVYERRETGDDDTNYESNGDDNVLVLLDVTHDQALYDQGLARELLNRVQRARKEAGLQVDDQCDVFYSSADEAATARLHGVCQDNSDVFVRVLSRPFFPLSLLPAGAVTVAQVEDTVDGMSFVLVLTRAEVAVSAAAVAALGADPVKVETVVRAMEPESFKSADVHTLNIDGEQVELVVGTHVFYTLGDLVAAEPNLVAA